MTLFQILLAAGAAVSFPLMCWAGRQYDIPIWKIAVLMLSWIAAAVLGAHALAFFEIGDWSGRSFFGAVILIIAIAPVLTRLLRVRLLDTLEISAPIAGFMYAVLKINCIVAGCCKGRILGHVPERIVQTRFPSQLSECIASFAISMLLLWLSLRKKQRGRIAPLSIVLLGVGRFILNWFREPRSYTAGMPSGNFWSLLAIIAGAAWLIIAETAKKNAPKSKTDRKNNSLA